jgi:hypothetical protein
MFDGPVHVAPTASELAVASWIGAAPERHGRALRELLGLADRIPKRRRESELRFPALRST